MYYMDLKRDLNVAIWYPRFRSCDLLFDIELSLELRTLPGGISAPLIEVLGLTCWRPGDVMREEARACYPLEIECRKQ
jgi:hypothetical protein